MYCLPDDVRAELKENGYLTTRAVEFLLNLATNKAQLRGDAFAFQVGALPVMKRDLEEFGSDDEFTLLRQCRDFFHSKGLHTADDMILPILEDSHYFVICFRQEEKGLKVFIYNLLSTHHRKSYWDGIIDIFFRWLPIVFQFQNLLTACTLSTKVLYVKPPQQMGTVDCGLFTIGFIVHLLVVGLVEEETFTQNNIQGLQKNYSN